MDARLPSETGSRPPAVWSLTQLSTVTQRFLSFLFGQILLFSRAQCETRCHIQTHCSGDVVLAGCSHNYTKPSFARISANKADAPLFGSALWDCEQCL